MNPETLRALLEAVAAGRVSVDDALARVADWPLELIDDHTRLDHHRLIRQGFPEFVFAQGKTPEQVADIMVRLVERQGAALATRVSPEAARAVQAQLPEAVYHPTARTLRAGGPLALPHIRALNVGIVTAGTSDVPVAEEAAQVAEFLGHHVRRVYDVGVAGLHRLVGEMRTLRHMDALIVVAGMEGALPSVVGGLVAVPVVAVPTSVGYGAHLGGLAPLLTMLNSCAAGLVVVNVDNGFGAALAVHRMASLARGGEEDAR